MKNNNGTEKTTFIKFGEIYNIHTTCCIRLSCIVNIIYEREREREGDMTHHDMILKKMSCHVLPLLNKVWYVSIIVI